MRQQSSGFGFRPHFFVTLLLALALSPSLAAQSGQITGAVTDELLAGAGGLTVQLEDVYGGFLDATTTAAGTGSYAFTGLADGDYLVRVLSDPLVLDLVGEYYDDVNEHDPDRATVLTVAGGAAVTGVDFVLSPGGSIAGAVTGLSAGESVQVQAYDALSGRYRGQVASDPATFDYLLDSQPSGSYTLFVDPSGTDRAFQWWDGRLRSSEADAVALAADEDATGKDFTLGPGTSISGTVSLDPDPGDGGATLQQLSITLFEAATYEHLWGTGVAGDGTYTLSNLPPGSYLVQAEGHGTGYMWELWAAGATVPGEPPVGDYNQATPIDVGAGSPAAGIDFLLEVGRRLSGHVFLDSVENGIQDAGEPDLGGVSVNAHQVDGPYGNGTGSDGNGDFEIVGLPPGEYTVEVQSSSVDEPFVPERWDDRALWENGDPVDLTLADAAGVDFGVASERVISGKIFLDLNDDQVQQSGEPPLDNVSIEVYEIPSERYAGNGTVAGDGRWSLGVRAGIYRVEANVHGQSLIREHWNDVFFRQDADPVDVTAADASGIDFGIVTGDTYGTLRGRLVEAGTSLGIPAVEVYVHRWETGESWWGATAAADGSFVVTNLPPGSFTVTFETEGTNAAHGTDYVATQWSSTGLSNDPDPAHQRIDYPAVPGNGTDLGDYELEVGGSISGRVTRAADGSPVTGYWVSVGLVNDPLGRGYGRGAATDENGDYVLRGLLPGDYEAWTSGGVPGLADQRRPGTVTVGSGSAVAGIDFALEEGTSISGTVTLSPDPGDGGATLGQIWMNLTDAATGEGLDSRSLMSDGTYSFDNLAPGSYLVQAASWETAYIYELWTPQAAVPGAPPVFENHLATPIDVDAGSPATGIDFLLDEGRRITGHVFLDSLVENGVQDPGEPDVEGASVGAGLFDAGFGQGTSTDENGDYTLKGLPPGELWVTVESVDPAQPFVGERWDDRLLSEIGDPVDVTAGDASGIDFAVVEGRLISGQVFLDLDDDQVRDAGEPPYTNVSIQVYDFVTGEHLGNGAFGADAAWVAAVPAGVYRVEARPHQGNVLAEYWDDVYFRGDADPVDVTSADAAGIDFGLVDGATVGTLRGRLVEAGTSTGIPDVHVQVRIYDTGEHYWNATTDAAGNFAVTDLPPGSFTLYFETEGTNAAHGTEYVATPWSSTGTSNDPEPANQRVDYPAVPGDGTDLGDFELEVGGSISGRVTRAADGSVVEGYWVNGNLRDDPLGRGYGRGAATDAAGDYVLRGLLPGDYEVWAQGGVPGLADERYPGTVTVDSGSAVTGIDFALEEGTSISGTVTLSPDPGDGGATLQRIWIDVRDAVTHEGITSRSLESDGTYSFDNLAPGSYLVQASAWNTPYVWELWTPQAAVPGEPPVLDNYQATPIDVDVGSPATGIDFLLEEGRRITGHVFLDSLVANGVQDPGEPDVEGVPVNAGLFDGSFGQGTTTDAAGDFSLQGLVPGEYRVTVEAGDPALPFVAEQWDDRRNHEAADPVDVTLADASGIDFAVVIERVISGQVFRDLDDDQVRDAGEPAFTNLSVQAHDFATGDHLGNAVFGADGTYAVGVPAGVYRLEAWPHQGDLLGEYWDNAYVEDDADAVDVTAADASGIDFGLVAADFYGTLRGQVTGGSGVPGVEVQVLRFDNDNHITSVFTGSDGSFTVPDLVPGSYKLYFETRQTNADHDTDYVSTFWSATGEPGVIDPNLLRIDFPTVPDPPGGPGTELDPFPLPLGGSISGQVFPPAGDSLPAGLTVSVQSFESGGGNLPYAEVDGSGLYHLRGLPAPATYRVQADAWGSDFVQVYYLTAAESTFDHNTAAAVGVEVDLETGGIDLHLERGGSISGTVTGQGTPIADVQISASLSDDPLGRNYGGWASTDAGGGYTVHGLPAGGYEVRVDQRGSEWANETYPDFVAVSPPADTPGIDFDLEPAGRILGRVTQSDGSPVVNLRVEATDFASGRFVSDGHTDENGDYTISDLAQDRDYRLQAATWEGDGLQFQNFIVEYWDDRRLWDQADPVSVPDGGGELVEVTGIDFVLDLGGAISGIVTADASGAPLQNVWVGADDFLGLGLGNGDVTDHNGFYVIRGLPEGDYRVQTDPWPQDYVGEFFDDARDQSDATAVYVEAVPAGGPIPITDHVDFGLASAFRVSGRVTESDGTTPIAGIDVAVGSHDFWSQSSTLSDGTWEIRGVPAGSYTASAETDGTDWIRQDQGIEVVDADLTGVDFALELGATVSGRVFEDGGDGVYQPGEERADLQIAALDWETGEWLASGTSDADGLYEIRGLAAGTYWIELQPDSRNYVRMYWDNVFVHYQSTPVEIVDDGGLVDVGGIDFKVVQGHEIRGTVFYDADGDGLRGAGEPGLDNVGVSAEDPDGNYSTWSENGPDGSYVIHGVFPGQYRVLAHAQGTPYASEFFRLVGGVTVGTYRWSEAELVDVSAGDAAGIDFSLELGGGVRGTVVDGTTAEPLAGIQVNANDFDGDGWWSGDTTDAAGNYHMTGLPPGDYRVGTWDPQEVYLNETWDDAVFWEDADPVPVVARTSPTDTLATVADFDLERGGSIEGRVYDDVDEDGTFSAGDALLGGITVRVDQHAEPYHGLGQATTAADGTYSVGGLPPGLDLRVWVDPYPADYVGGFYDGDDSPTSDQNAALAVTVASGTATTGVDFGLLASGAISGTVADGNGDPLPWTWVNANNVDTGEWFGDSTDENGDYVIHAVSEGTYRVVAGDDNPYRFELYDDQTDWNVYTPVPVTARNTTTGIDFVLPRMPRISGGPTPASGVRGATVEGVTVVGEELFATLCGTPPCVDVEIGGGVTVENLSLDAPSGTLTFDAAVAADATLGEHALAVVNRGLLEDGVALELRAFEVAFAGGDQPAASPERLYLTDSGASQLRVYGTTDLALLGTVDLCCNPSAVALTPDGSFALVNGGDRRISVIDTRLGEVGVEVARFELDGAFGFQALDATADRLFALDRAGESRVVVFDTATWLQVDELTLGATPYNLLLNPAGDTLYVLHRSPRMLTVVDVATLTAVATVPLPDQPRSLAVTPGGTQVYVGGTTQLMAVDASAAVSDPANAVVATLPIRVYEALDVAPHPTSGKLLAYARHGAMVAVVDVTTGTPQLLRSFVAGGFNLGHLAATADRLFLSNDWGSLDFLAVDADTVLDSALSLTRFDDAEGVAYHGGGMAVGPAPGAPDPAAPAIASVSGPATNGAPFTVTLAGSNLGSDVDVWLRGTRHHGTVLAADATSMTVEFPAATPAGSHFVVASRPQAGGPLSGVSPAPLAVQPAAVYAPNQEVYLTSYGSDRLTIYEPGGGRDAIGIQHYGVGLAVTPDGTRGVAVQLDNSPQEAWDHLPTSYIDATVVDLDPDSATYRQAVATVPWLWSSFSKPVATPRLDDPNGIFVYTPNYYLSDTVSVIDPWAGAEVDLDGDPNTQSIPLEDPYTWIYGQMLPGISRIELDEMVTDGNLGPYDTALTPAGDLLYVTNLRATTIMIVDTVSHQVVAELDWGGQLGWVREVDIPPTGDFVYVTGGDAGGQPSLFVMVPGVLDDSAFVDQIPLAESVAGIAVSADGATAYLTARFLGELWAVDVRPSSRGAIETIPLAVGILGVDVADDDQLLYVANLYAQEVYVVDLHPSRRHQWITTLGAEPCPEHLAFQPAVAIDKPVVAAVSPASGAPDGGDPVVIVGAAFDPGAAVTFGGVAAAGVVVESPYRIAAITPPGSLGSVDVKVTNPDNHNGVLAGGFTYADDVTAPVMTTLPWVASEVLAGAPGSETVTLEIRWQTDEPADSAVDYRPVGAPTFDQVADPALVEDHAIVVAGLLPATDYELVIASADRHGNAASSPMTHTTLTAPDVTAPIITAGPTVVATTTTTATVEWTTHELATSVVQWDVGTNGTFNRQTVGPNAVTHSVTLTGLTPNTLHEARVLSVDASGNGPTVSAPVTFTTNALPDDVPPVIVDGPEVAYLSNNLVIVLWTTDEVSTSFVRYGVHSVQEQGVVDVDLVTQHVVFLTNLLPGTTYGYRVGSTDASGNTVLSADPFQSLLMQKTFAVAKSFGFTTPVEADTTAPAYTTLEIVLLADDRVLIRLAASESVRLQAFYGSGATQATAVAPSFDQAPSLVLAGLLPDTLYSLRLVLTDPAGNATPIDGLDFRTPPAPDTAPPVISALAAAPVTATTARITWATDEPADATVRWGGSQIGRSTLATGHSFLLTGLTPATAYGFEVESRDASGNAAVAAGGFTTGAAAPVVTGVAPSRAAQGATVEVAIHGEYLAGAGLDAGSDIGVGSLTVNAAGTRISALLAVAPAAAVGPRPLTVSTSGGEAVATFTVVDTTVPEVTITEPQNGAELPSPTVTVRGTVSEPVVSVTVNGVAAELSGLTFEAEVTLPPTGGIEARRIVVHAVDASGNQGTAIIFVSLSDAGPPELHLTATPSVLWPPNHQMVPVTIGVSVTDDADPSPAVILVSVTSSEPDDAPGNGDGRTVDDIQGADVGTDDREVLLRAERAGGGGGRIYTLTYRATDQAGNWVEESVEVTVPHDQGG